MRARVCLRVMRGFRRGGPVVHLLLPAVVDIGLSGIDHGRILDCGQRFCGRSTLRLRPECELQILLGGLNVRAHVQRGTVRDRVKVQQHHREPVRVKVPAAPR